MLELMHHDYFKRPELAPEISSTKVTRGTPRQDQQYLPQPDSTAVSSNKRSHCKPVSAAGKNKAKQIGTMSEAQCLVSTKRRSSPPRKRTSNSALPGPRKPQIRSSHLKPTKLSNVFSLANSSSYPQHSYPYHVSKAPCQARSKRRTNGKQNKREKDALREYLTEDELREKYRGISFHIFDEEEVLQAIAEAQGRRTELMSRFVEPR